MTRCRVEQDELDHDTQQGQWKSVDDTFDSIFLDTVEALEPEPTPRHGRYIREGGKKPRRWATLTAFK
jgi:hypothetical protein